MHSRVPSWSVNGMNLGTGGIIILKLILWREKFICIRLCQDRSQLCVFLKTVVDIQFMNMQTTSYEFWGFHGCHVSCRGLLGYDVIGQRSMLPPSSPWMWWQRRHFKLGYPITALHEVTTQIVIHYWVVTCSPPSYCVHGVGSSFNRWKLLRWSKYFSFLCNR